MILESPGREEVGIREDFPVFEVLPVEVLRQSFSCKIDGVNFTLNESRFIIENFSVSRKTTPGPVTTLVIRVKLPVVTRDG